MSSIRRYYIPNAVVFITCVTKSRRRLFQHEENIDLFWHTLHKVQEHHAFQLLAYVILTDHFHWLIKVDDKDGDFSKVMHSFKRGFTFNYKRRGRVSDSLQIWQNRFWDHVIRDEKDLENHLDYIHWNPVKHGLVKQPQDWPHSSFHQWVEGGYYGPGWGINEPDNITQMEID